MPPETFVAIVGRDGSRRRPGELALMPRVGYNSSVIRVVICDDHPSVREGLRLVVNSLAKDVEAGELMAAIRTVASGSAYVSGSLAELLAKDPDDARARAPHEDLTDRELSILRLLARGNGPSEVARKLCLSTSTVETCRSRILARLGLKSTAELVRYVIDHGLTD